MKIDPYAPCPGGCNKKIKFCDSCKNHLGDLEKIYKLLDGDQRAACLELCEKVNEKTPDRACVLSVKALLELQLGMTERTNRTVAHFLKKFPENPVALSEKAIQNASEGLLPLAVDTLQTALQNCTESLPGRVLDAISVVARALLVQGYIQAARGHLMLELGFISAEDVASEDSAGAMQLLMRINNSSEVPLMLKDDACLKPCADDSEHLQAFVDALALAGHGSWRGAERSFTQLAAKAATMPAVWHNIAVLRGWLADQEGSVVALRKLAALDIPLDEAVEAETMAQLLDERTTGDEVELLRVVFDVSDLDQFLAALAASPRMVSAGVPPRIEGEEPPPRAAYSVLDRDNVASGVSLTKDDLPSTLGRLLVFGRQTDREARVELLAYRGERLDSIRSTLREIAGDMLAAEPSKEEVMGESSTLQLALSPTWHLPEGTPREQVRTWITEFMHTAIFERLPKLPFAALKGKTLEEAASDESLRIRALAVILSLELAETASTIEIDFNQLRSQLGLPIAERLSGSDVNADRLPLVRFTRLIVEELSDDALVTLYRRAAMTQHAAAIEPLGSEVVRRESLTDIVDKAEAYAILARHSKSSEETVEYLAKARKAAAAQQESPARWYLEELMIRIERGEVSEAKRILHILQDEHFHEPGVKESLYRLMAQVQSAAGAPAARPQSDEMAATPQAAAPESKLWTSESEQSGGGKLWTPD